MFFLKDLPTRDMIEGYAAQFDDVNVEQTSSALHMLRNASLLIRKIEKYLAQHGLSQTQFLILIILHRDKSRDFQLASEIAEKMDVSKPVLSTTLKTLLKNGLILHSGTSTDARTKPINISAKGEQVLQQLLPGYFAILQSGAFTKPPTTPEPTPR